MGILARNLENKNKNVTTPLSDIKYVFILPPHKPERKIIVYILNNDFSSNCLLVAHCHVFRYLPTKVVCVAA